MMVQEFSNGDAAYLNWMKANPDGYVANTIRARNTTYFVLHRSGCKHIADHKNAGERSAFTGQNYIKVCSLSPNDILAWARWNRPLVSTHSICGTCKPAVDGIAILEQIRAIATKEAFEDFLFSNNVEGSGKASSYVKALDYLRAMLNANPCEFTGSSNVWVNRSTEVLDELHDLVKRQQQLGDDGPWAHLGLPKSYLADGYCSAALNSFRNFLPAHNYEESMLERFRQCEDDKNSVSTELQEGDENEQLARLMNGVGRDANREIKTRCNQNIFRQMIKEIYGEACCVTGLSIPQLNRASHIVPWAEAEESRLDPSNGLYLLATYDAAFDKHLISLDDDYRMIVSSQIKEFFTNDAAHEYFEKKEGHQITLPGRFPPRQEYLQRHRDKGEF